MRLENPSLGIVYWFDAQSTRKEPLPSSCPIMESVGYITVYKDRVVVQSLVTPDRVPEDGICVTIPKGCIKSILLLKPKGDRSCHLNGKDRK